MKKEWKIKLEIKMRREKDVERKKKRKFDSEKRMISIKKEKRGR